MNSLRKLLLSTALSGALAGSLAFALPGAAIGASGLTPAMAMLTAYSRTLTDEVASYEATYTGASHKTMFDQYGKLTFAPNNFATQSNTFNAGDWLKFNSSVASGVSDPDGGSSAWTLTATSASGFIRNIAGAQNYQIINSIWIKRRTGTGQVTLTSPDGTLNAVAVTTSWQQFYYKSAPQSGTSAVFTVTLATSGDEVDIYQAQREYVTHETTPRAYNATTSAAYYGYRCVYAPETLEASTTSITIGSGSSYTFTTAAAHSFAVGDVVQATDNADPDNWIRGYVTATTSTTVTLASYTFPGTAYSRPVLTNGSGTISDWSVIRSDGYLAEPAATPGNIAIYSQGEFDNATYWLSVGVTSVGAPSTTGPSGVTTGQLITSNNGAGAPHLIYSAGARTITSGSNYAHTVVFERGTHRYVTIALQATTEYFITAVFDLDGGGTTATETDVGSVSGTIVSTKMKEYGSFVECTVVGSVAFASAYMTVGFASAATGNTFNTLGQVTWSPSGTETFYVHSIQTELGSVATSYIPTAASSVARSADVASMTGANFSGWYATIGTFLTEFTPAIWASNSGVICGATSSYLYMYNNGSILRGYNGSVVLDTGNSVSITSKNIAATSFDGSGRSLCLNGSTVVTDSNVYSAGDTSLGIGRRIDSSGKELNGVVHSVMFFASRESDAQLVTLTGG